MKEKKEKDIQQEPEDKPEREKKKLSRRARIIITAVAAYLLIMAVAVLLIDGRHVRFYLNGEQEIETEFGEKFTDPGRKAYSVGRLFGESKKPLKVKTLGEVDTGKLGKQEIKYSARCLFINYTVTRTVNVVDTTPPEITLRHTEGYEPSWFEGYEEEGYTAEDLVDGDVTDKVERKVYPDRLEYTVTDSAGNTATVTRESNFSDTAPHIELLGDAEMECYAGARFDDPGVKVTDKKGNDLSGYLQTEGMVIPYKAGDYELRYYIENTQGDVVEAVRSVKILPAELPETIEPDEKTIYLTFDDGPGPYTDQLLDILDKYNVKVTFFVTCLNPNYSDCIGRAYREGHSIGAHTACHDYYTVYSGEDAFFADLAQVQELIYAQTGSYTTLTRFPGGSSNTVSNFNPGIMTRLSQAVTDSGYRYFDWNVSSGDAGETTDTDQVVENVINGCAGRKASVVLQHDIKDYSVNAVEQIIIWGIRNGYTFRALDMQSPSAHHGIAN